MQCVHSIPMAAVPTRPKMSPPFLKALGMARMPLPRLLLIKCNKAPLSLYIEAEGEKKQSRIKHITLVLTSPDTCGEADENKCNTANIFSSNIVEVYFNIPPYRKATMYQNLIKGRGQRALGSLSIL